MSKPLTIARQEFVNELTALVENAELPAFAISNELQIMIDKIKPIIDIQYQTDLQKWQNDSENANGK